MILHDKPLFTEEHGLSQFRPAPGSAYLYAVTTEDRSEQAISLQGGLADVQFHEIREPVGGAAFESELAGHEYVGVRDSRQVAGFLEALGTKRLVIDMTGLTHPTWVPLVKTALDQGFELAVVYFEPTQYTLSSTPRLGEFYDLSDKTGGIGPLPLMINIADVDESEVVYVPILGFEGQRSAFMFEQVNPDARRTYPIVGLPGFRIDYPFESLLGNNSMLIETKAHRVARYARSNCPFSLYYRLMEIRARHPDAHMRIGLTGTKPHALGALLFAIAQGSSVELVYDHVKRKARRTEGADRCVFYRVSDFMNRGL